MSTTTRIAHLVRLVWRLLRPRRPATAAGDPMQCDHYLCRAEAAAEVVCLAGFDWCCGCCAPDYDTAWELAQEPD